MNGQRVPQGGRVVVLSTYELGRQPFGAALAAGLLRAAGADVDLVDLSLDSLSDVHLAGASLVAISISMHTSAVLAQEVLAQVRRDYPAVPCAVFGLYGPLTEGRYRSLGAGFVLGGECEQRLVDIWRSLVAGGPSTGPLWLGRRRQPPGLPDRSGLAPLERYAQLRLADGSTQLAGSTEASRGCRHHCRHCPVAAVYQGRFVPLDTDAVVADVRHQWAAGARHVTFGDPDFLNGPAHSLRVLRRVHAELPELTFDVTVKVEHVLAYRHLLGELRDLGCILLTTAIESFDDDVLAKLGKGHTADDAHKAIRLLAEAGIGLNPTFVPFTPWTSVAGYRSFLHTLAASGLAGLVAPAQYAIRLLVTDRSALLDLPDIARLVDPYDPSAMCHPWRHTDPDVDALWRSVTAAVADLPGDADRRAGYLAAAGAAGLPAGHDAADIRQPATVPYLTEGWFC